MLTGEPRRQEGGADAFENNKLHKRLCRLVGQAIGNVNMVEDGDRLMVCLSGGKEMRTI